MKKVVLTGANGFIGSALLNYLKQKNFKVKSLQRTRANNIDIIKWEIGKNFPKKILNANIFIHCAYDNLHLLNNKKNIENDLNYIGLKKILKQVRSKSRYKFILISSQSAHKSSKSYYGKSKYQLEKMLNYEHNKKVEITIRPGMVYARQNSYVTELLKKLIKFKIFPIFSNKKNIQPIAVEDLCECINKIILDNKKINEFNLASYKKFTMREYIRFICKDNNLGLPYFIYIPSIVIISFGKLIDLFKLTKFSLTERIYGYIYLNNLKTKYHLKKINYKPKQNFK